MTHGAPPLLALMYPFTGLASRRSQGLYGSPPDDDAYCVRPPPQVMYMTGWSPHDSQQRPKARGSATVSFQVRGGLRSEKLGPSVREALESRGWNLMPPFLMIMIWVYDWGTLLVEK